MKNWNFIFLFLIVFNSFGQENIEFHSISEITNDTSEYKVIFISAKWCGVCKSNQAMIEKSEGIFEASSPSIKFFKIEDDCTERIIFSDETFYFVQNGPSTGHHQFIEYLMNGEETIYPSFVVLNKENQAISMHMGFINEQDWLSIISRF